MGLGRCPRPCGSRARGKAGGEVRPSRGGEGASFLWPWADCVWEMGGRQGWACPQAAALEGILRAVFSRGGEELLIWNIKNVWFAHKIDDTLIFTLLSRQFEFYFEYFKFWLKMGLKLFRLFLGFYVTIFLCPPTSLIG